MERVLISCYPQPHAPARETARKLIAVAVQGRLAMDWAEIQRIAGLPGFRVWPECKSMVKEVSDELEIKSPYLADE